MGSASVRAAVAMLAGLLATDRCRAAPSLMPGPVQLEPTAVEILYGVSADDERWYNVLNQTVKMDEPSRTEPMAAAMLAELGLDAGTEFRVQPVVRHLVTHPGSTGTQYQFGVAVLGAGLACQLVRTVLLHVYFVGLYAVRSHSDVPDIRQCLSHIQLAMAGYVNRLSFFGRHPAVEYLVNTNRKINSVFAECDEKNNDVPKTTLLDVIKDVCRTARALLADRCTETAEKDIAPTVHVTNYNDKIFSDHTEVEDHQLLAMIENLDQYEYVDFGTMNSEFWIKWLEIKPYMVHDDEAESNTNE